MLEPVSHTSVVFIFASFLLASIARAKLLNHTIDDQYGDPVGGGVVQYTPADVWNQGATCSSCGATPDKGSTFNQTWHDATADDERPNREMTLTFNGTLLSPYI